VLIFNSRAFIRKQFLLDVRSVWWLCCRSVSLSRTMFNSNSLNLRIALAKLDLERELVIFAKGGLRIARAAELIKWLVFENQKFKSKAEANRISRKLSLKRNISWGADIVSIYWGDSIAKPSRVNICIRAHNIIFVGQVSGGMKFDVWQKWWHRLHSLRRDAKWKTSMEIRWSCGFEKIMLDLLNIYHSLG